MADEDDPYPKDGVGPDWKYVRDITIPRGPHDAGRPPTVPATPTEDPPPPPSGPAQVPDQPPGRPGRT